MHQHFEAKFPQIIPALNDSPEDKVFQPPLLCMNFSNINFFRLSLLQTILLYIQT